MNDICIDTALVRLSDAAGFEGVDSEVMRSVACAANAGARMVRFRLGGEDEQFLRAEHYIVMRAGGHAVRRYINTIHEQLRGGHCEVMA